MKPEINIYTLKKGNPISIKPNVLSRWTEYFQELLAGEPIATIEFEV